MITCENSGHKITNDFLKAMKIAEAGAVKKLVLDYEPEEVTIRKLRIVQFMEEDERNT